MSVFKIFFDRSIEVRDEDQQETKITPKHTAPDKLHKQEITLSQLQAIIDYSYQGWTGMYTLMVLSLSTKFIKNSQLDMLFEIAKSVEIVTILPQNS